MKELDDLKYNCSRRHFLSSASLGLGALGLASLLDPLIVAADGTAAAPTAVDGPALPAPHLVPRVKRVIYPAGFRWSRDMKPIAGGDRCMHAHVAFLARGRVHVEYSDGCVEEYAAPQVMAVQPGHDAWVVGDEPAVLIEFDFERETVARLGLPAEHRHG